MEGKKFTQEELVDLVLSGNIKKEESFLGGRVRVTMIFPSEAERMELRSSIFKEKGQDISDWELACAINEELNIVTLDNAAISFSKMNSTITNMIHSIRDAYSGSIYDAFLKDEIKNPKQ